MKKYVITVNDNRYEVEVEEVKGDFSEVSTTSMVKEDKKEVKPAEKKAVEVKKSNADGEKVECPMPGKILKVNKAAGDSFKKGDVLFVLEAMKMENEIMAPHDGNVIDVNIAEGAMVNTGDVLAVIQ
ncbi:biotin/lipoyl-containing protein [Clostridium sp. KNHs214]|uniref:biotin/lipoyl-containing protein n=1 Tax=Clostridium sp. KNHs214 TaxID=1540257 RepID=UPI000552704B|nr:biotin/lipoyl-containing protein [Clostridium sp. KNHs214]